MKRLTAEQLIEIRRDFHRYPDLSGQEHRTMEKICEYLEEWDIPYEKGVAGTGVVALIRGKQPGKTVGIRGDIDALPVEEENKELPYCSQRPGIMHACGHDAHTTIVLGAAYALKQAESELRGNVKLFFQPAEETTGGAAPMIKAGCLENPHVDYVLGLHVHPEFEKGIIGVRYGKMYAASDMLSLTVTGTASHGAHPEEGVDAIVVAANILTALQTVVSRNVAPVNAAVCTFGTINGGRMRNQIADRVELQGIIRTLDPETRTFVQERVRRVCEQVAEAMGAEASLEITQSYSPLINSDNVVEVVRRNAELSVGKENVVLEQVPEMGTEDFSYFAAARESCFFHLGCRRPGAAHIDLHNPLFDIDEACLEIGVDLQVRNVFSLLELE